MTEAKQSSKLSCLEISTSATADKEPQSLTSRQADTEEGVSDLPAQVDSEDEMLR